MHIKRGLLIIAIIAYAVPCYAKAYYANKTEMIQKAECIAIVTITKIEKVEKKSSSWSYRQKAYGKVEQCLKGNIEKEVEIYGMETFICAQCRYEKGRFLLFLMKKDGMWVGSNWNIGICSIKNEKVQWLKDDQTRHDRIERPLGEVIDEIKNVLKVKYEVPVGIFK